MATLDQDKKAKLQQLQEQLLDVYLEEANPENWVTEESAKEKAEGCPEKEAAKLIAGWKGDRYWEKKNAAQTMTMLIQIDRYLESGAKTAEATEEDDDETRIEKEMKKAEKEAKKRLARTRPKLIVNNK